MYGLKKILIMGLPGAGKTTLAKALARKIGAVHYNADEVRAHINKDLGFDVDSRIEQARRMGWLCDQVVKAGGYAIADFVCPTAATREAFIEGGPALVVYVDRISSGRFEDTNKLFVPPDEGLADCVVLCTGTDYDTDEYAASLAEQLTFAWKRPTALFIGRYQPFHDGHRALIVHGIKTVGQACIAVRDTQHTSKKDPFSYEQVKERIEYGLRDYAGAFVVIKVPNVSHVMYGRDVGYAIERVELGADIERISATDVRKSMGV